MINTSGFNSFTKMCSSSILFKILRALKNNTESLIGGAISYAEITLTGGASAARLRFPWPPWVTAGLGIILPPRTITSSSCCRLLFNSELSFDLSSCWSFVRSGVIIMGGRGRFDSLKFFRLGAARKILFLRLKLLNLIMQGLGLFVCGLPILVIFSIWSVISLREIFKFDSQTSKKRSASFVPSTWVRPKTQI